MQMLDDAALRRLLGRAPARPRVLMSGSGSAPFELLAVIDECYDEYTLHGVNVPRGIPVRPGITHETAFLGPGMRGVPDLRYLPSRLSMVPQLVREHCPPDVVAVQVSRVVDGKVSLGIDCTILPTAIETVKARGGILVGQVNTRVPYTFGDTEIPVDLFDGLWAHDREVAVALPPAVEGPAAEAARRIGELCAARVQDGSTLQLGIGEVPDATLPILARRKGLRVWTELISDGLLHLHRAGALDRDRVVTSSIVLGSRELYDHLDRNERVVMRRCEVTNSTVNIAAQHQMTSINTALQIDLLGQANASRIGRRIFSGFGGQTDFIVGAMHAPGGQALMALRSMHAKAGTSTIVGVLHEPTTSFQHTAVITENGVADIFGRSEREQAVGLIEHCAHPSVRELLWLEATELGLV